MKKVRITKMWAFALMVLVGCAADIQPTPDVPQSQSPHAEVVHTASGSVVVRSVGVNPAEADAVLFEQQGYVVASDRLLQMDILRRAARGQLSDLFGEAAFEKDEQMHAVGLVTSIENSAEKVKAYPEVMAILNAFARGVNRYIGDLEQENPTLLGFYRRLTRNENYELRLWAPIDTVAVAQSMAFILSSDLQEKLTYGKLAFQFEETAPFVEQVDFRPLEKISILQTEDHIKGSKPPAAVKPNPVLAEAARGPRIKYHYSCKPVFAISFPMPGCDSYQALGSNNWVVSPQMTGTGNALLANDPHLHMSLPALMYEMALDSVSSGGTVRARGMNVPGIPGILIGHNDHIAWGMTNSMSDVDEIYAETFNKDFDAVKFKKPGTNAELEVAVETKKFNISVRTETGDVEIRELAVRWVPHHGPLFSEHFDEIKDAVSYQGVGMSYKWTGHQGTREVVAMMNVMRAKNFGEFKQALALFEAGAQNLIYADRQGNIGYYSHGLYPIRNFASKEAPPFMPVFGMGSAEWDGFREKVPEIYNPESGYIVTANNDPFGKNQEPYLSNFEDYFGYGFVFGSRAKRIADLLKEKSAEGPLTMESMRAIQYDHKDLMAERFVGLLVSANLEFDGESKAIFEELSSWDKVMDRKSTTPTKFVVWMGRLMKEFANHFPEMVDKIYAGDPDIQEATEDFLKTTTGIRTVYHKLQDGINKRDELMLHVLKTSVEQTPKAMVLKQATNRPWGEVHRVEFINMLKDIFPAAPAPRLQRDGSYTTVDMAGFKLDPLLTDEPESLDLGSFVGPTFRLVMEVPPVGPIHATNVLLGGNKGSYSDPKSLRELLMWRDGKHRELSGF